MTLIRTDGEKLSHDLSVCRLDVDLSSNLPNPKYSAAESIRETLKINDYLHTDLPESMLPQLLNLLDNHRQKASLVLNGHQLVTALPPDQHMLGLALDLGTTKLAAYLVDLETGQTLASQGMLNPQAAYGENILSRIQFANAHTDGRAVLQHAVVEGITLLAAALTAKVGLTPAAIVDGVIAGNTAMHHLLVGLPVHTLGSAPYHPSQVDAMRFVASEIGLKWAENACVYLPPNIAGFVGGDHIAMLLAIRARHTLKTVLALDIGANTEISLMYKGRHLVCSCGMQNTRDAAADIRGGVRVLLHEFNIEFTDIDLVFVAGAFDAALDLADDKLNRLLPELPLKQIHLAGNAAGSGARELLLSTVKRAEAESMPEHIEYIELSTIKDYGEFQMDGTGLD